MAYQDVYAVAGVISVAAVILPLLLRPRRPTAAQADLTAATIGPAAQSAVMALPAR